VPGDALKKYGKDITALAKEGKLDEVIGRDEEIRRTMQVLSRRTKNNPVLIGEVRSIPSTSLCVVSVPQG
jgi:ATP-dependent Clp protease ATP-binding subunit ClpB